jgi:hypothetical protein
MTKLSLISARELRVMLSKSVIWFYGYIVLLLKDSLE